MSGLAGDTRFAPSCLRTINDEGPPEGQAFAGWVWTDIIS